VILLNGIAGNHKLKWKEPSSEGAGEARTPTKRARRSTKSRRSRRQAAPSIPALTENDKAVLAVIRKQPKGKGIVGKEIITNLSGNRAVSRTLPLRSMLW
jgi:hypothetical protein